jgi:extracellular factor (EF) 3-hydroxypalmitic acid methyl ester biosynthesis protein
MASTTNPAITVTPPRLTVVPTKVTTTCEETRPASAGAQDAFAKAICSKLEYLNANDVNLMLSKAKPVFFTAGEKLIREGVPSPGFFMVRSGEVEVRRGDMKLASLQPGDVCGEMSFLENSNASASVVASKVSTIEFLSADELHGIFAAFPHLASRFYRSMALTLSRRLRATSQQLVAAQQATK